MVCVAQLGSLSPLYGDTSRPCDEGEAPPGCGPRLLKGSWEGNKSDIIFYFIILFRNDNIIPSPLPPPPHHPV